MNSNTDPRYINLYYIWLIFINNIKINCLLMGYIFYPDKFKTKIIEYKTLNDEYYKYLLLLSINNEISAKYNIDIFSIGLKLYDKYQTIIQDNEDKMSEIEELSDIDN